MNHLPLRSICRNVHYRFEGAKALTRRSLSMYSLDSSDGNYSASFSSSCADSMSSIDSENSSAYEPIDDLVDQLVCESTKRYATTNPAIRISKEVVWSPQPNTIELAVKKLDAVGDAGKSYYELRILAAGGEHYVNYDTAAITSVLIGYACLDGIDGGLLLRRYTFQDSQHLYNFCELLGEKGRFEDAAF
ncbi:expressed unknown protein [Seminavis robusta]|uniref:Uncharacterized protein n=1 Tax=Seminavis robusta TaxID=568900 RepID=A0A9N8HET4_9STRA|nr:expressed unknown protein [Seminavis robusta]|eukprot:Sro318_g116030.1 n/a (190) ;mRNA; f:67130-67699